MLTEIDVQATLREKLGQRMGEYLILGACNPPLAHRALATDISIGLLLPCNVVIRADAGQTVVEALDPQTMVTVTGEAALDTRRRGSGQQAPVRARVPAGLLDQPADDPHPPLTRRDAQPPGAARSTSTPGVRGAEPAGQAVRLQSPRGFLSLAGCADPARVG